MCYILLLVYLGLVGMFGVMVWYGLNKIMLFKLGQIVVVSVVLGVVGSVVGQFVKFKGCCVVGFVGGKDKCDYVVNEFGFDVCIDYKVVKDLKELYKMFKEVMFDGIDLYFENVGGVILDVVFLCMNVFGCIVMCGMIVGYDGQLLLLQNL